MDDVLVITDVKKKNINNLKETTKYIIKSSSWYVDGKVMFLHILIMRLRNNASFTVYRKPHSGKIQYVHYLSAHDILFQPLDYL